jgi:DNA-binding Xre family transcriptional regulator
LRIEKRMSQTELAHSLGISQTALCEIESGKTKKIDFSLMDKVCQFFEVDFDYFKDDLKFKQVNKGSSTGYLSEKQVFNISDKLVEQFEKQIKDKDCIIDELKITINELKQEIIILKQNLSK